MEGKERSLGFKILFNALPIFLFFSTGWLILVSGGQYYIAAGGWDIYIIPVAITLAMLVISIIAIKKTGKREFLPINHSEKRGYILSIKIAVYFTVVMILRQLMIWKFYNPWEKLPLVFMVVSQLVLVEKTSLRDVGLKDWNGAHIGLAIILAGCEFLFLTVGSILVDIASFGGSIQEFEVCGTCQLYWLSFPYQAFAVGYAEELFFRGYIQTKMRVFLKNHGEKLSLYLTLAITNLLFGLFHAPWYVNPETLAIDIVPCIRRVVSTGIMGLFMSYLYEKTGSLAAPILFHGFSNSIQPLFMYTGTTNFITGWLEVLYDWRFLFIRIVTVVLLSIFVRLYTSKQRDRMGEKAWESLPEMPDQETKERHS
ncbi:MAG: lysostaphin resistance A-like protein [Promethearchaeota archaeon]